MNLNLGDEYYYWGSTLPPDDAIRSGIAAYKNKYNGTLPRVVFCNPAVLPMVENLLIGLEVAANKNLNSHVFAFNLPRDK